METQEKAQLSNQIEAEEEGFYVDKDTGEIIDVTPPSLEGDWDPEKILFSVGEKLCSVDNKIATFTRYKEMVVKSKEKKLRGADFVLGKVAERRAKLVEFAGTVMANTKEKTHQLPGMGEFTRRKSTKTDRTNWDDLTGFAKETLSEQYQGLFDRKVEIKPDLKAIKLAIKSGKDVPGFSLVEDTKTSFKGE